MHDGRAGDEAPAKTHVVEPRKVSEPCQTHFPKNLKRNAVQKRSYRRALQRISAHGYTWYKGKLISGASSYNPASTTPSFPTSANRAPPSSLRKRRLNVFSWNCGSMTQTTWDHFQQWLSMQSFDIVLLQETHWQFSSEWTQGQYHCMHSGVGPRQAGLLTMIATKLVQQHGLSWSEPIKGRVLHTRLHGLHRGYDIINVYQHVYNVNRLEARAHVWNTLHELFDALPKRNSFLLAGDLNTSLHKRCSAVGLATFDHDAKRHWGPVHRDAEHFHNLLQVYNMVTLNTWKSSLGPTYSFGTQVSRIDYLCIKKVQTDQNARDVHYLHAFPLLNLNGAKHVPLVSSVLKAWTPSPHVQQPGWSRAQRKALYQHWIQQDEHADALRDEV